MLSLKEYWHLMELQIPCQSWNGNIACIDTDASITHGSYINQGFLSCYIYTLVEQGKITINYNDCELTLHKGDLYIYSPGFHITVLEASQDYRAVCLLADERFTLSLPSVYRAIHTTYFPIVQLQAPVVHLSTGEHYRLQEMTRMMTLYQNASLSHTNESLKMLFELFLLDLSNIQESSIKEHRFTKREEEIFLGFLGLLPLHFIEHHDIAFYADKLCITPRYLSRIVHEVSGRTVINYINQMLLMEASYLLRQTSLSVAQIADRLHFAETTTFARFFNRMKGMNPKDYRK